MRLERDEMELSSPMPDMHLALSWKAPKIFQLLIAYCFASIPDPPTLWMRQNIQRNTNTSLCLVYAAHTRQRNANTTFETRSSLPFQEERERFKSFSAAGRLTTRCEKNEFIFTWECVLVAETKTRKRLFRISISEESDAKSSVTKTPIYRPGPSQRPFLTSFLLPSHISETNA